MREIVYNIDLTDLANQKLLNPIFSCCESRIVFFCFFSTAAVSSSKTIQESPCYLRTIYLRITFHNWSKMDFLSANSRFAVQNDGKYVPRITRETCTPNPQNHIIRCMCYTSIAVFCLQNWLFQNSS